MGRDKFDFQIIDARLREIDDAKNSLIVQLVVGGQKAGSLGNAVIAVFLPLVIFSIVLGLLAGALLTIPLVGAFAGLGGFVFAATHVGPLLLGAILGGLMVGSRP